MAKLAGFICKIIILFAVMRNCFAVEEKLNGKSCPVWSSYNAKNDKCECYTDIGKHFICNDQGYIVQLNSCSCSTYNWSTSVTTIGYCLYGCISFDRNSFEAPTNISDIASMCGSYKRNGTLCGTCHKETYPAVHSFSMICIYCKHVILSWITFLVWSLIPVTIFYMIIMLLSANLMSSKLSGYILFSQSITSPFIIRVVLLQHRGIPSFHTVCKIFGAIYGIWNLDFLKTFSNGICLRTNSLVTLFLDIVIVIYPLCLIIFTHKFIYMYGENKIVTVVLKPIVKYITRFKRSIKTQTSLIDSVATFIYLVNIKILNSCFDLLMPVKIYMLTDNEIKNNSTRLFYDADIVYFGAAHKPYGITALIVLIFFVFLPTLLLLVYPFKLVQKLFNLLLSPRCQLTVRTFVESFNRCYKDGTKENEKDCRYFAAFPFIIRISIFLLYLMSPNGGVFLFCAIVLTTYSLVLAISEPFKDKYKHLLDSYILFNFLLSSCCVSYSVYAYGSQYHYIRYIFDIIVVISLTIPGVYIVIYFLYIFTNMLHKHFTKWTQS